MAQNTYEKRVSGTVTTGTKNKNQYSGGKTETATVHVDPKTKVVTVDVNIDALLDDSDENPRKAFPAHLGADALRRADLAYLSAKDEEVRAKEAEAELKQLIDDFADDIAVGDGKSLLAIQEVEDRVTDVETNYASKTFVHEQILRSIQLSKQVVDSIDLENNTVTIDGKITAPVDGVIYLLKDPNVTSSDVYQEYTTIDGQLTLIGNTNVDLTGYATEEWVKTELENYDLSEYAKKTDIPDVSEFITQIPKEYVTETELDDKKYLTEATAEEEYASKVYVQSQLSKIGTLSKEIVDGVDLETNKVIINGIGQDPVADVVYLVKDEENDDYDQYTAINGLLTFIGSTSVNLEGYATESYVDTAVNDALVTVENLLKSIKFIDGGKAPLV